MTLSPSSTYHYYSSFSDYTNCLAIKRDSVAVARLRQQPGKNAFLLVVFTSTRQPLSTIPGPFCDVKWKGLFSPTQVPFLDYLQLERGLIFDKSRYYESKVPRIMCGLHALVPQPTFFLFTVVSEPSSFLRSSFMSLWSQLEVSPNLSSYTDPFSSLSFRFFPPFKFSFCSWAPN